MESKITVYPTPAAGLCNKLRTVFYFYKLAKEQNKSLTVLWKRHPSCDGFFLDYFKPVPDITFVENRNHKIDMSKYQIDYEGNGNFLQRELKNSYPFLFNELSLKESLAEKLQFYLEALNSRYIAVHIRRTDHLKLAKRENVHTTDEQFFQFLNNYPDYSIYVATDNKKTFEEFYSIYASRIPVKSNSHTNIQRRWVGRNSSLEDAIIDLYLCIHADYFMGSGWSSFTDVIDQIRCNSTMAEAELVHPQASEDL